MTTAASVDVVYAIAGFGVCARVFGHSRRRRASSAAWRAPTQIVGGALLGYLAGRALGSNSRRPIARCPHRLGHRMRSGCGEFGETPARRAAWLLGMSLLIPFAGAEAEMTGGAALGVIVASAAAAREWGALDAKACGGVLNVLWNDFAQPLLFALIGAAVDVSRLSGGEVGAGVGLLAPPVCACAAWSRSSPRRRAVGVHGADIRGHSVDA